MKYRAFRWHGVGYRNRGDGVVRNLDRIMLKLVEDQGPTVIVTAYETAFG